MTLKYQQHTLALQKSYKAGYTILYKGRKQTVERVADNKTERLTFIG